MYSQKQKICKLQLGQKGYPRAEFGIWHYGSSIFDGIIRFWAFGLAKMAGKAIFFELLSEPPINSFCNAFEKTGNRWRYWQFDKNDLSCHFGKPKSSESDNPIKNRWTIKSDSKFSSGVAFLTMLKFAYFWHLGLYLGSHRGPLSGRTSPNMIFGMSFDSLMTSARKIHWSKKFQSLRSEVMCHPTLRFKTIACKVFIDENGQWYENVNHCRTQSIERQRSLISSYY